MIYVDPDGHQPEFDAGPSADFSAAGEQGIVEFIAYLLENEQDNPYWLIFLHYFGGYENDRQGYINTGQADQGFSMASGFFLALDSVSQIEIVDEQEFGKTWQYQSYDQAWDTIVLADNVSRGFAAAQLSGLLESFKQAPLEQWEVESLLSRGCSFEASTLVATIDGFVPISEIREGDYVLAFNEETQENGYYVVTRAWAHLDPAVAFVTLQGETIEATPWHRFYTDSGWFRADELSLNVNILRADGTFGLVEEVRVRKTPQIMYDLAVDEAHTFYVGEQSWLVHSCDYLPSNARSTVSEDYIFKRLEQFHGVDRVTASARLHAIKARHGRGGDDNVLFDLTGNVYDPASLRRIGSLTVAGGG